MIKESAILHHDGTIYIGRRHHNVIAVMIEAGIPAPITGKQGFVTDTGEFVGRKEGARIALECGQIKELQWPPNLYSEDLY